MVDQRLAYTGYGVPAVDFSILGNLPQDMRQAQLYGARRSLADLAMNGRIDPNEAAQKLFSAGDIEGGLSLAKLAEAQAAQEYSRQRDTRDFAFREQEAKRAQSNTDRTFGLQQQQFTAGQEGTAVPAGFERTPEGLRPRPGGPQDPTYIAESQRARQPAPTGFRPTATGSGMEPIPGGPQDPTYIESAQRAKVAGGEGLLDDDTIKAMAAQYRAGDTSVMQNLGRGAQGAQNIVKLRAEITRQNSEAGLGGADQAVRNAEFFGTKAGQRTLGTRQAGIELAATEFAQVLPVVQRASAAVSRTNYPDLNRIIQAYEQKTGDPNIVAFGGGINTLINLYARAISPSGAPTVSDKDHAREILSRAWSQGQFDVAVGMMKQEIDAALSSPEKVRDDMRRRFLGGQGGAKTESAPAPAPGKVPEPPPGFQLVR